MSFGDYQYTDILNLSFPIPNFPIRLPDQAAIAHPIYPTPAPVSEVPSDPATTEKCMVCDLAAHGMHFGVIACRPCAAFFRRFVVLKLEYTCLRNDHKCDVEGRGRTVCRNCRYRKCLEVGMTTDNVQYNRDSASNRSFRVKKPAEKPMKKLKTRDDLHIFTKTTSSEPSPTSSEDVFERVHVHAEMMATEARKADEKQMDEVIEDLKNILIEPPYEATNSIQQCLPNELHVLSNALLIYRRNQKPAQNITFVPKIGLLTDAIEYYRKKSRKFSQFIMNLNIFAKLPEEDKLAIVKLSFPIFDRLERSQMTAKLLGKSSFLEKKFILTSYCGIDLRTVQFIPQTSVQTEAAEKYVKAFSYRHANDVIDNLVKPLFELNLDNIETTFMLIHVIASDNDKTPSHISKIFNNLRERIRISIHHYYEVERKIKNYGPRILEIMKIVASMKRIQAERALSTELVQLFEIYNDSSGQSKRI